MTSISIDNAATVVPFAGDGPVRGEAFRTIEVLEGTSVIVDAGVIVGIGSKDESADCVVDATGCTVVPGFVDPHTHLPFFGWRADEDAARLSGLRYETLHKESGGISAPSGCSRKHPTRMSSHSRRIWRRACSGRERRPSRPSPATASRSMAS